ncbi:MAG: hypothetical protein L0Y72_18160 [Gemmataceae bacterium]|nr:hypothetical protein [Gemmataceae bacterium]MCI0740975.1 hypothetical protein [Gemmataceae bacterium]
MASLLEELFHDLGRRATQIAEELSKCRSKVAQEVEPYCAQMESRARRAALLSASILKDPDLHDPIFSQNFYLDFRDIARLVQGLEHLPLLVLRRFDEQDLAMTRIVLRICQEAGYPYSPPICSCLSSQYFWTMPDMDLIFVPALEPYRLLGMPDIYHELGHIILFREEKRFKALLVGEVEKQFDLVRKEAEHASWAAESIEELEAVRHLWRSSWWVEFGADLIATFLVGPSFGWCNIRTCTSLGGELFRGSESHPPDDARAIAIGKMLDKIGATDDAFAIGRRWSELLALSGENAPQRYDTFFPERLFESFCELVMSSCLNVGLKQWTPASTQGDNVVAHLHRTWSEFRERPESFTDFERDALRRLGLSTM